MTDIKVQFKNHSFVTVTSSDSTFYELRDYFSFRVEGYQHNPKFKHGLWDGYIRLLKMDGTLPFGLWQYVVKFAKQMDYTIEVDDSIHPEEHWSRNEFDEWISKFKIYDGDTVIDPYDEQKEAVFRAFNHKRLIIEIPTSGGKSLIAALSAKRYLEQYDKKVLIVVPTVMLVKQIRADMINYRLFDRNDIHMIKSGTEKNADCRVYVSTWQSACKMPKEWLDQFGIILNDECHEATANNLNKIIDDLDFCEFKIGLTGTLKDGKANILTYIGMFGPSFKPKRAYEMMEEGKISKLNIKKIFLMYPLDVREKIVKAKLSYQKEIDFVTAYKPRNEWIINLANKLAVKEKNVLCLFRLKKHGKLLYDIASKLTDKVVYVDGDIVKGMVNNRDDLKDLVENNSGIILIASLGVLSTGVSWKNLHHGIFAHPQKGKIKTLQTIGRLLRKHASKSIVYMWDISDHLALPTKKGSKTKWKNKNHGLKHAVIRVGIYNSERFEYDVKTYQI